jgi:hypothetical protein
MCMPTSRAMLESKASSSSLQRNDVAGLQGIPPGELSPASDLRVNVCDQNRVWFLTPRQVNCPVLIGADYAPSCNLNQSICPPLQ